MVLVLSEDHSIDKEEKQETIALSVEPGRDRSNHVCVMYCVSRVAWRFLRAWR